MRPRLLRRATPPRSPCRVRPRRWCCRAGRSSRRSSRAGGRSFAAWPTSAGRWRRAWPTPMRGGSSTATSSPRTCCWTPKGVVWITDFGLAKASDDGLTQTGDILGTLRYMAPERFRGEGDGRADVYALGLTLYELLTLRPAFDSPDRLQLIEQIKAEDPPRPRALDRRIPRDLETIVLKAIAKDPKDRYPSADALAEDLRRFLADEPIRARRVGPLERAWIWAKRRPAAAALLLVSAVAALAWWELAWPSSITRAWKRRTRSSHRPLRDRSGLAKANRPWTRPNSSATSITSRGPPPAGARATWSRWRSCSTTARPTGAVGNGTTSSGCVTRTCSRSGATAMPSMAWRTVPTGLGSPRPSADGTVKVWDAITGRELRHSPGHTDDVYAVAFSPDGRQLASAGHDKTVRVWDVDDRAVDSHTEGHTAAVSSVAFSPDGRRLASGNAGATVQGLGRDDRAGGPLQPPSWPLPWIALRTVPMGDGWPRPATTLTCGSGMRRPASSSTISSPRHMGPLDCGLQPRRQPARLGQPGRGSSRSGTSRPGSSSALSGPHQRRL